MVHQQHTILNRHQPVPSPIDQQQPTTRPIQQPIVQQTIVFLRLVHQLIPVFVPVLFDVRVGECEGVLVVVDAGEPFAGEEEVGTCALADGAEEAGVVGVG